MLMHFLRHRLFYVLAAMMFSGALNPPKAQAQAITAASLTDEQVQKAITALVDALYERKHPERFWELERVPPGESNRQTGGYTALVTLALLHAGQSYQDPRLRDAIDYLASLQMQGTYAVTMRACVWAHLPPRFRNQLGKDAQWLIDGFNPAVGGWDYVQNPTTKYHDNSIRQFGALALWEASKREARIDRRLWQRLEDTIINLQREDGGWNYKEDHPSTGSMTAAGLATLFITEDLLHSNDAVRLGPRPASRHQAAIDKGMAWMDRHFLANANPGKNTYFHYYMYSVERIGLASGYKYFGGRDWFREGASELIRRMLDWQNASSRFVLKPNQSGPSRTDEIAFTLLFLSRGRVPVAINKLEFEGAWNNRPRDVANLVRWIGEESETDLNWQIVNIKQSPEAWLDSPLLYIASNEALSWLRTVPQDVSSTDVAELHALKRYIELGGMILAVNEGGPRVFAESFERAGSLMFPGYEWQTLPQEHWAYSLHTQVRARRPQLRALSNGVRELIIVSTSGDISATFQKYDTRQQGEFQTLANIYYYATELNRARPRLAAHVPTSVAKSGRLQPVRLVRAMHDGNWNAEPQALQTLSTAMAHQRSVDIRISDHPLAGIHEIDPPPELVYISGTDEAQFSPSQISAIKLFVVRGGVILFETAGGRGEFTASAERSMSSLFGAPVESALRTRIVTGEGLNGAIDLTRVEYRPYTLETFGSRETAPRLRCMALNGDRPQLFFSREDLSHALLDQPRWGVSGYSSQAARDLLANLLQHAAEK